MKTAKLDSMVKGWFIGDFTPTLYKTKDVEVAVKSYREGEYEEAHYHKIATEFTVIINGRVRMFSQEFSSGDIIIVEPEDVTDFYALTDTITAVVKLPGASHDKYTVGD